jgi:hypothetical protein
MGQYPPQGRQRWFQVSVRTMMAAVVLVAGALTVTSGHRTVYRSCHLCHNRMRVESRLVSSMPVSSREAMETRFPVAPKHQHVWWTYARSWSGFMQGTTWVADSWGCYSDGSAAPDGRN